MREGRKRQGRGGNGKQNEGKWNEAGGTGYQETGAENEKNNETKDGREGGGTKDLGEFKNRKLSQLK